jgi:hypothetical protein
VTEGMPLVYVVRSETPLPQEELLFHMTQFTSNESVIAELAARGYRIVGYTNDIGFFDLNDRLVPGEGVRPGLDLMLSGPLAKCLMPREMWKYQSTRPVPTAQEAADEAAKRVVLAA